MAYCKYLSGNGATWYECTLRHKKCGYQQFCSIQRKYKLDKCPQCPAFKDVNSDDSLNTIKK